MKLLVVEVGADGLEPAWEENEQTRLGEGFYAEHRLQPGPLSRTAACVARLAAKARELGAESVRVIATSAAREAVNGDELVGAIHQACGLGVEIISGETEAEWSHAGVRSNPRFRDGRLLVLDVGGGSTEFIVADARRIAFRGSFELGTVRAHEALRPPSDPTSRDLVRAREHVRGFLRDAVLPRLRPHLSEPVEMAVGVGGTTALLALIRHACPRFDRALVESTLFDEDGLRELTQRLWGLPLARRRELPGLPPERADVILTGAVIYESVVHVLGLPALGISTRGLRYGALMA